MKKAYMHAIEGVIASMLVLIYLSTLISSPEPTDWRETALTQQAGDVLETVTETGIMEQAIRTDSPEVVSAVVDGLGADMEYTMQVDGLPKQTLNIGIVMNDTTIIRTHTADTGTGTDLPNTEGSYRSGDVLGIDFVLSDTTSNNISKYNAISFDFNGNDAYNDTAGRLDEGPYRQGDTVRWCPGGSCTESYYEVGYINDTVTLYNMTPYRRINTTFSTIEAGQFTVQSTIDATDIHSRFSVEENQFTDTNGWLEANISRNGVLVDIRVNESEGEMVINTSSGYQGPYQAGDEVNILGEFYTIDSLVPFEAVPENILTEDVLFHSGSDPTVLAKHQETVEEFLSEGGTILQLTNMSRYNETTFEGSFHDQVGFEWIDYPVIKRGDDNVLEEGAGGTVSDMIHTYFSSIEMTVPEKKYVERPSSSPVRAVTNATIRGNRYSVNASLTTDVVTVERQGFRQTVTDGDRLVLEGTVFRVQDTHPLSLRPQNGYRFTNWFAGSVAGGTPVLTAPNWEWNNTAASWNVTGLALDTTPVGAPPTDCASNRDYKSTNFTVDGQTYDVVTTNIRPCDDRFDYVNFDFNADDDVGDDVDVTDAGYGAEGIYQAGEAVEIDDKQYRVSLGANGTWVYLERIPPTHVGTARWVEDPYNGNGDMFVTGQVEEGIDNDALLQAVMMRAAITQHGFSRPQTIGSPSVSFDYSGDIDGEIYTPYYIETVWWFQ